MKTRILSSLIMMPFLIVLVLGGYVLVAFTFLISVAGCYEFFKGFNNIDIKPSLIVAIITTVLLYLTYVFNFQGEYYALAVFVAFFGSMLYLFNIENRKIEDGIFTFFGIIYIVGMAFFIVLLSEISTLVVWLVILSAFGTDIFAYFTGMLIGKHKLCPKISPKKTIEGSIGGIIGSGLLCGIFGYFVFPGAILHCVIIGIVGSPIAQIGDLTASIFKRKMGIKDYGHLIPGHGGILDRFDSVLFTAPFVYFYITLIIN